MFILYKLIVHQWLPSHIYVVIVVRNIYVWASRPRYFRFGCLPYFYEHTKIFALHEPADIPYQMCEYRWSWIHTSLLYILFLFIYSSCLRLLGYINNYFRPVLVIHTTLGSLTEVYDWNKTLRNIKQTVTRYDIIISSSQSSITRRRLICVDCLFTQADWSIEIELCSSKNR